MIPDARAQQGPAARGDRLTVLKSSHGPRGHDSERAQRAQRMVRKHNLKVSRGAIAKLVS